MKVNRAFGRVIGILVLGCVAVACGKKSTGANEVCGDGVITVSEGCDDGNVVADDGCSDLCAIEAGWSCDATPSVCEPVCGDGRIVGDEECDDQNVAANDGCSDQCVQEVGWTCEGEPSECAPVCGDGVIVGGENCDGSDLAGQSCATLGLDAGVLACGPDCVFDVSQCIGTAECGNGEAEFPEACDATDLAGETCVTLGYGGGVLDCTVTCEFDLSACDPLPVCGNDAVETGEQCDGADLAGETCVSLGWDQGNLDCLGDCSFDTSDCSGSPPLCGDGQVEGLEVCDDGNTDDCDGCRGDCLVVETGCGDGALCGAEECDDGNLAAGDGCGPTCLTETCGNGYVDPGEQCDGVVLATDTCVTQGHDGGTLACAGGCVFDESQCVDCAPGLTFCPGPGACVDLLSDNDHCGGCGSPCGANTVCIAGLCEGVGQPWVSVGTNPVGGAAVPVLAHDLATDGALPTVALVEDVGGGNRQVRVYQSNGGAAWNELAPSPSGADWFDESVSLAYNGATPFVAFGGGSSGPWGSIRVLSHQGGAWQEVGTPGFPSACGMHMFIDLALDGATPHLTAMGAGGCGIGVDYAWYDGAAWQTHPSTTGFPGQLTMNGQGNPAIVFGTEPLIGLADFDPTDGTTIHTVQHWDGGGNAWAGVHGELDMNLATGWQEHIALALDPAGTLYSAWVESDGGSPPAEDIYVSHHDATAGLWFLVGAGQLNGAGSATLPSIVVVGTTPWVAYVETTGVDHVLVRRYDVSGGTWDLIGPALNEDPTENATAPVIVSIGGVPYVAFREEVAGPGSGWRLYVKRFP